MFVRSRASPSSNAMMPSIACEMNGGGADSMGWRKRRTTRARVRDSVGSGSHTDVTPRSDHAIAHEPMVVSNNEKETTIQHAQAEACALLIEVPGSAIAGRRNVGVGRGRHRVRIDVIERFERRADFAARQQAWTGAQEYFLRGRAAIEEHADEAVAHLIPVLRTSHDLLRRIRIEAVGRRVVEVAYQL